MFQIESLAGQMQRSLKIRLVFCVFATFLHSNLLTHVTADQAYGQTYLQEASLPFWPVFPPSLKVRPTAIEMQHQAGIAAGIKVRGEGPGFVLIAQSDKSMIFAAPPRLAPAWHVECELISCDLKRVANDIVTREMVTSGSKIGEGRGRAAYQAALTFVALYTGFNENMTSRQIEDRDLPAITEIKGTENMRQNPVSKPFLDSSNMDTSNTLLQGFR